MTRYRSYAERESDTRSYGLLGRVRDALGRFRKNAEVLHKRRADKQAAAWDNDAWGHQRVVGLEQHQDATQPHHYLKHHAESVEVLAERRGLPQEHVASQLAAHADHLLGEAHHKDWTGSDSTDKVIRKHGTPAAQAKLGKKVVNAALRSSE